MLAAVFSLTLSAQDKKKVETVTYETSIDCDHCVNTIMDSLPLEKGIKNVKCDLETKEVIVTFKTGKTDKKTIKRSIEKLGYTATEKKEKKEEV